MTREEFMDIVYSELHSDGDNCRANRIIDAVDEYVETEKESDWIPVSKRLPEEETDVLICNGNGDIELSSGSYSTEVENDFIWYTSGWRFGKVIAWMPLPAPYEAQERKE